MRTGLAPPTAGNDATDRAAVEAIGRDVVDSAFHVHAELGPGLLESAYEHCLIHELTSRGVPVERQVQVPVHYKDTRIDAGFRLDLLVAGRVIVEIKSVEKLMPIHQAQMMTYLRLTGCRLGFLVNFNTKLFKDGLKRVVM